ncbi:hypothetical protein B5C34_00275 [Pacificimonas flava]|uniref:Phage shock protein B n=2 Tax=Pacificimonas TaxID=1960290 RepID=A0A219B137_9SPHN|nr:MULTISPECIES: hypothetical protein [Pacificimonas]MBZ6380081.1 hypothetical protein [Pacificimonas aurantium]OWV32045.1 hypothetical protein B5C34_00275 [Pacificimonas flava]
MNIATMIVLIVLIAVIGRIIVANQRRRGDTDTQRENAELRNQIGELKQRIQTLERIATDKSRRLARDIEQLDDGTEDKRD